MVGEAEIDAARQRLLASGIFADVTVEAVATRNGASSVGDVDLLVTIDEKWTLLAFPFFSTGGGETRGGVFLLESNLLGFNKQLIGAGIIGTNGFSGFMGFIDPAVRQSKVRASFTVAHSNDTLETTLPDGTPVRSYERTRSAAAAGIGYQFTERFEVGTTAQFSGMETNYLSGEYQSIPYRTLYLQSLETRYRRTRIEGPLTYGTQAAARLSTSFDDRANLARVNAEYAWRAWNSHRMRIMVTAGVADVPVEMEEELSGRDLFRTLPPDAITAADFGAGALFWDIPLYSASWGAVVGTVFGEYGAYQADAVDRTFYGGPGAGVRVYLKQIALPAVGLDVGYNVYTNRFAAGFAIGLRP